MRPDRVGKHKTEAGYWRRDEVKRGQMVQNGKKNHDVIFLIAK